MKCCWASLLLLSILHLNRKLHILVGKHLIWCLIKWLCDFIIILFSSCVFLCLLITLQIHSYPILLVPCSYSPPSSLEIIEPYRSLPRVCSPLAPDDVTQRVRQTNLIGRFNDMFGAERLDAMDTLRRFCDDHENNQRIVFITMQVCWENWQYSSP